MPMLPENNTQVTYVLVPRQEWEQVVTTLESIKNMMLTKDKKLFYSPKEFAELIGRSPHTVTEWCRKGRINAVKTGEGSKCAWEIPNEEVENYFNRHKARQTTVIDR